MIKKKKSIVYWIRVKIFNRSISINNCINFCYFDKN